VASGGAGRGYSLQISDSTMLEKPPKSQSAERGARGDPKGSFDGALEAAQDIRRLAAVIR
jgi:hypothetical protein